MQFIDHGPVCPPRVLSQRCIHLYGVPGGVPANKALVALSDRMGLELSTEMPVGRGVAGGQEHSGRVPVDAVDGECFAMRRLQQLNGIRFARPVAVVDRTQARRFVDHDEAGVFKQDREGARPAFLIQCTAAGRARPTDLGCAGSVAMLAEGTLSPRLCCAFVQVYRRRTAFAVA